jgi:hypothetical protein
MVEIALCLAIIGFALVAIIGVLPSGLSVQKDNREQTIINLDAAFLMDALRSGTEGQDDLTNYVHSITIWSTLYAETGGRAASTVSNTYGIGSTIPLTSGAQIVGLLSTPKYVATNGGLLTLGVGYYSNTVIATMRAINSPAIDQGPNGTNFAFYYQVQVEVLPSAEYAYAWASPFALKRNVTAPGYVTAPSQSPADVQTAATLQNNLNEIRLSYRWPILPGGGNRLGGGRQVFRSSVAGAMMTNTAASPNLYFIQPLTYQASLP